MQPGERAFRHRHHGQPSDRLRYGGHRGPDRRPDRRSHASGAYQLGWQAEGDGACSPCPCGQIKLNRFTCANQLAVYLFVMPSVAKPGTSVTVKVWTCTLSTPSGPWMVVQLINWTLVTSTTA